MPAVESRDGQNVHHGEDDRQEGGLQPEILPVPRRGENAADGDEPAQLLVHLGLGLYDHLQLLPVGGDHVAGPAETCRDRLPEGVCLRAERVGGLHDHADRSLGGDGNGKFQRPAVAQDGQLHRVAGMELQIGPVIAVIHLFVTVRRAPALDGDDLVAFQQLCGCRRHDAVDQEGHALDEEFFIALVLTHGDQLGERERQFHLLSVALHDHAAVALGDQQRVEEHHRVLHRLAVDAHQPVPVAESETVARFVEVVAPFGVFVREIGVAPSVADADVDGHGQHDVHHHAGDHHQEAFPGGF